MSILLYKGMKFALIELKLALIRILKQFEVHASSNTPVKLDFVEGIVRSPKQPIKVVFKKRTNL